MRETGDWRDNATVGFHSGMQVSSGSQNVAIGKDAVAHVSQLTGTQHLRMDRKAPGNQEMMRPYVDSEEVLKVLPPEIYTGARKKQGFRDKFDFQGVVLTTAVASLVTAVAVAVFL